jgi:DNA-binding transcriptional LysR family regulator
MLDPRDLDDLIAIARTGSLSAAARRRGVAISTISRRIETLENALKLRLIDRLANGTRLTRHGAEIARVAEPLALQLDRVTRTAEALREDSEALPVRLTATEFVISDVLAPALPRLWKGGRRFPLHLQSEGAVVSLAARDADLAIRMSRPEGASLIARKLPPLELGFYASPQYLNDRRSSKIDPAHDRLLVYDESYGRLPENEWIKAQGLWPAVALRTGSTRALLTAARAGAGVAMLPVAIAGRYADLLPVPMPDRLPPRTPWLLVHQELRSQPSIRQVHRWVVECFALLSARREC